MKCEELNIDMMKATEKPRKRKVPTALQGCMLSSFLTHSSDAVPSYSAEIELKNRTKLDFFLPVIDAASSSIDIRFNAECLSNLKHISLLMARGENFDNAVRQLCSIAKLDGVVLQKAKTRCSPTRHIDLLTLRRCPCPAFKVGQPRW